MMDQVGKGELSYLLRGVLCLGGRVLSAAALLAAGAVEKRRVLLLVVVVVVVVVGRRGVAEGRLPVLLLAVAAKEDEAEATRRDQVRPTAAAAVAAMTSLCVGLGWWVWIGLGLVGGLRRPLVGYCLWRPRYLDTCQCPTKKAMPHPGRSTRGHTGGMVPWCVHAWGQAGVSKPCAWLHPRPQGRLGAVLIMMIMRPPPSPFFFAWPLLPTTTPPAPRPPLPRTARHQCQACACAGGLGVGRRGLRAFVLAPLSRGKKKGLAPPFVPCIHPPHPIHQGTHTTTHPRTHPAPTPTET